ncbi:MAG: PilZ domain-containing protein [Candidatus Omnitrophica bacterium]|nr:PilZ domain-containing protein [Candidatus Omnitrophota bacterium]
MSHLFNEKRESVRFMVPLSVTYRLNNENSSGIAKTNDISQDGLCLITQDNVSVGSTLDLWLAMPDNGESIRTKGKVIWIHPTGNDSFKLGVKLEGQKLKPIPLVLRTISSQNKY